MLHTVETLRVIDRLCEKENGVYKFTAFESATEEDKLCVIRFDNSFYFIQGHHVVSNIDEVKKTIEYKGMTYEEVNERLKECLEKGLPIDWIDW